jgi:2-dehydropantoate 2-reductase
MQIKVLVVGCGAIGGVTGGYLAAAGTPVWVLTTNAAIAHAARDAGLSVHGDAGRIRVQPRGVLESPREAPGPFDFVLLATQPPQVEQAAVEVEPLLAASGRVVCFQNGLCEDRLAQRFGRERVVGAVVGWGASMRRPGDYIKTSSGGFTLGRLDGGPDARLLELARLLEAVGPVTVTDNLSGVRWSKLALNCAVSTLGTIAGQRLGRLMGRRFARRLGLEIVSEVVSVARAEGVVLEKVAGTLDLDWLALTDLERKSRGSASLAAKHALILAVSARFRRLRSSMLAALERGRPPAVDFLNGEVVARAEKHGLPAPINAAARDLVWRIARGEQQPCLSTLRALYDATR